MVKKLIENSGSDKDLKINYCVVLSIRLSFNFYFLKVLGHDLVIDTTNYNSPSKQNQKLRHHAIAVAPLGVVAAAVVECRQLRILEGLRGALRRQCTKCISRTQTSCGVIKVEIPKRIRVYEEYLVYRVPNNEFFVHIFYYKVYTAHSTYSPHTRATRPAF